MLQLKNTAPFKSIISLFPDENGIDTLYVIIKGTFQLGQEISLAEEQVPPVPGDEYWGEPGKSSLKYASDMHLGKPSTDVVLVGRAWSPRERPVEYMDVGVAVAERRKAVRVFGDRVWRSGIMGLSISPPEPFESMPLVYERAFGGRHAVDPEKGEVLAEERNPVGRGFRGKQKSKAFIDKPLPNIEDPRNLLAKPGNKASPACFGFIAPSWLPRRSFAGTYDEAWQKKRAPYLPEDFDSRFFNAAHPDLVFDRFLKGGEPVQVIGACRTGPLGFSIPLCRLRIEVKLAGQKISPTPHLETVLIEPEQERLSLVWRGAVSCDKKALKVEEAAVYLDELRLEGR